MVLHEGAREERRRRSRQLIMHACDSVSPSQECVGKNVERKQKENYLGPTAIRTRDLPICSRPPYHLATEPSIILIMQFPRDMYFVL